MTFSKKKVHYFNPKRTMKKKVKKSDYRGYAVFFCFDGFFIILRMD